MTKKDYQSLAGALWRSKPEGIEQPDDSIAAEQWRADRDAIATALERDNPRFDRDTFVAACEDGNVGRRPKRVKGGSL